MWIGTDSRLKTLCVKKGGDEVGLQTNRIRQVCGRNASILQFNGSSHLSLLPVVLIKDSIGLSKHIQELRLNTSKSS